MLTSKIDDESIVRSINNRRDNFIRKDENQDIIILKISAAIRIKELTDQLVKNKQDSSLKNLIVTINHEFNNLLTAFELELRLHKKQNHKENPDCMQGLDQIFVSFKSLVEKTNNIK